ncbi:hypothetical protein IMCC1923_33550 [Rhodobacteraceae bacterium IMCC1923]|nr:hypothetical protein [Rhodobacteraceae bacterium IMCC1923]
MITLTTSEALATPSSATLTALEGDFDVKLNGNTKSIDSVSVSGTSIILTLDDYVPNEGSNTLTVAYALDTSNPIEDLNGNDMATISNARAVTFVDDTNDPGIVRVFGTNSGPHSPGDTVQISVLFDEVVLVVNVPELEFQSDATATYVSGSGAVDKTLVFDYLVGASEATNDLQYKSVNSFLFVTQDATVQDPAGNYAVLTLPALDSLNSLAGSSSIEIL